MTSLASEHPVTLAPDGAWTWFNDPRAIFVNGLLYFGRVRDGDGRAVLEVFNPQSGLPPALLWSSGPCERDDHNNPAILALGDGRLMAFYTRHSTDSKTFTFRISKPPSPSNPEDWDGEQTYRSEERISYANPIQLKGEAGRIYNFMRNRNYNPTVVTTDDFGGSWSPAQILIQTGSGARRPYVKYASNGNDRIDFFYSDGHPRDEDNSLYHAYYTKGGIYRTDGTFLKNFIDAPLLHDAGERGSVVYQFSTEATSYPDDHVPNGRAWCWDLAYDSVGNPVAAFSVQRDNVVGPDWSDDRISYHYARWVPGSGWEQHFIAHGGRPLYEGEDDYAGGICLDPLDPNVIYLSSNAAEPFNAGAGDELPLKEGQHYELYRGVTSDGGKTFCWQAISENSSVDNLRPFVPGNHSSHEVAVIWFAGLYTSYTSWATSVKGLFTKEPPRALATP